MPALCKGYVADCVIQLSFYCLLCSLSFLTTYWNCNSFCRFAYLDIDTEWTWHVLQEQYIFVYDALLEALKAGKTVIGCSEFKQEFDKLCIVDASCGKSKLQQQYEASNVAASYQFIQPHIFFSSVKFNVHCSDYVCMLYYLVVLHAYVLYYCNTVGWTW